ncbi:GlsB/YeaQ/YmgE family stress response membrane protein [soil metagenome]
MDLLWTLLIGLLVGVVAKFLMPGTDPGGVIITMILGVAGAFIAGYLGRFLGWYGAGEPVGFIASVLGAVLLLLVYRTFTKSRMAH